MVNPLTVLTSLFFMTMQSPICWVQDSIISLTWNSPLLAAGMVQKIENFLIIGEMK
jgi:hypothetical protein